jgi:TPR repeat protein
MEKMELLIERANEGDVVAMGELGVHYYKAGDYEKAFGLLSSAALQWEEIECDDGNKYNEYTGGDDWATYWLGECYLRGLGVEKNVDMAIKLWEAAADFSDGVIIELGYLYTNGEMIEPDYERAAYWWKRALNYYGDEEKSQPLAQYELGMCYYHGRGVEKNEDKALRYLEYFLDSCCRYGVDRFDPDGKMGLRAKQDQAYDIVDKILENE